ncbi:hypothetical protein BD324DRAFT_629703 [Kockovaella imperatae]|uniref:WW domain-containing protein n=1 Tax=Kockovaella imperatae TaxID=4999 RepID=A0A1Y1UEN1_9TREE|nr:hypothetical protein BD324DRAFT_629703 [Kockovaella imperatae]ORX35966.1 hypothetical protein BD324DRAFT_629703 [Kockovaella imperatae]
MSAQGLHRANSGHSYKSSSSDESSFEDHMGSDARRSMDDERRDLPPGWVRCFDPKTEHHFYVEEATRRSIWVHPYDDPEYIASIPDTHPAHPNSEEAQQMRRTMMEQRARYEELKKAHEQQKQSGTTPHDASKLDEHHEDIIKSLNAPHEHKSWLQRQKDKFKMSHEERKKHREEKKRLAAERRQKLREQQADWMRRRQELAQKQMENPQQYGYASDPYGYAPPNQPYNRAAVDPYGYGE